MEPTAHRLYTLLLFAVTLCLIVPAYADSISGTFDGNATLTPTGTTGVYIQNFSGDGTDDRYGAFDVTSMSTVDFSNPPNITFTDGMLLETFGGGTLFGTGSGTGLANGTVWRRLRSTSSSLAELGYFSETTVRRRSPETSPRPARLTEAISNASYTGTLVTPEPSSLGLLLLGASMGYRLLVKARRF